MMWTHSDAYPRRGSSNYSQACQVAEAEQPQQERPEREKTGKVTTEETEQETEKRTQAALRKTVQELSTQKVLETGK
jgi:hypothetical protein